MVAPRLSWAAHASFVNDPGIADPGLSVSGPDNIPQPPSSGAELWKHFSAAWWTKQGAMPMKTHLVITAGIVAVLSLPGAAQAQGVGAGARVG
jgi:hypothetical protein